VTFDDYRAIQALNWSLFKHLDESPLSFRWHADNPTESTTGQLMGRVLHSLVLTPDDDEPAVWDGDRRGKAWVEFSEQNAGRPILRRVEYDTVKRKADAVLAHPQVRDLLAFGDPEATRTWTRDGVACKGRLDWSAPGIVVDLKGAGPLSTLERVAVRNGWHRQLEWYRHSDPGADCYIVAVEDRAPHDVGVWRLSPLLLDAARRVNDAALEVYRRCVETGVWPGRMPEVVEMACPAWLLGGEDEDLESFGEVGDE
jgi:hypothetical protein